MLSICEIFYSIQGESSRAGCPCVLVRLSGCNLNCSYCDTPYHNQVSSTRTVEQVLTEVARFGCDLVEISGGEPLVQEDTPALCRALVDSGSTVLVETNGTFDIGVLPPQAVRIVDIKCPGSGEGGSFYEKNFGKLRTHDEVKFVVSDRADFDWACRIVEQRGLCERCTVLFGAVDSRLKPVDLAQWILDRGLPVRLNLQLHKILWGHERAR